MWFRRTSIAIAILVFIAVPALADPVSPFTITNTDSPDPIASGQELTYAITVVNTGGSKTTEVVMTDQLNGIGGIGVPPQLQITSTRGSCTQSATLVTCSAGTIEGGGSWTVTIRGVVDAPNGTVINNTASVTGTRSAQNFTSTTTTTTLVNNGTSSDLPDLTITKNGPSFVAYGQQMTYTLIVNNQGLANATDVTVVDTVPTGITDIAVAALGTTSLFQCDPPAGQTIKCWGGRINQGANATITITGKAPMADAQLTNTASVDPYNTIAESNELNNTSALVNTQVMQNTPSSYFSITKVDAKDPIVPGDIETYTVTVRNLATTRADDVVIIDGTQGLEASTLTATFEVTDGTIGNFGGCTVSAPQAKCMARTLNPGGMIVMTVTGKVVASAGSTLLNTSTVTGNIKNTGYSATATEKTTVKPAVDLTITKGDAPDPVCARSWPDTTLPVPPNVCLGGLTYTLVVGNSGIYQANSVLVRDPLPPDTKLEKIIDAGGFTCAVNGSNVLECKDGTIAPESRQTIVFNLLAPATMGPISNTATVDPENAIFESDETNNSFTQATQVATGVDLTVAKYDYDATISPNGFDPIATSGTQTYVILVNNYGTQDARNIRLRDTLPSGTRFRDVIADPDHNFTCAHANGVIECVGGMLKGTASNNDPLAGGVLANPPDTAKITIRIFAQSFAGKMHNEVRVDPLNEIPEANEANNIAVQDTVVGSFVDGHGGFNQLTIDKVQDSPDSTKTARNAKTTWTITVGNTGTDTAVGITVRDFLPAGSRYIEATGTNKFNCNQVGGHIDCVGGEIDSHATAKITLTAFAPDTPGDYVNQAIVDPDNTIPEGNELDNETQAKMTVKNAGDGAFYELSAKKTQTSPNKLNTARNAIVTYEIVVTNSGTDDVIAVKVRDMLPAGSRYIEARGDHQFLCTETGGIVDCLGGQILGTKNNGNVPGTAKITLTMFAPDTPGDYINQVIVDPDNTIPEGDEENNQTQEKTTVANGGDGPFNDLTIKHEAPPATTVSTYPNGPITFALTISNLGDHDAQNVAVRDVLPPDVTFVRVDQGGTGAPFNCSVASGVVDCIGATITAGGNRTLNIQATAPNYVVNGTDKLPLHNVATVDPDNTVPEGNESNNTTTALDLLVTSRLNLKVEQSGPTSASQSDVTDYEITVTNEAVSGGGQVAQGVVMVDTLPPGLIPLAVTAGDNNNWGCQIFENAVNFVRCIGDLNNSGDGSSVKIKITVFITAENGRALDNTACVDPDNTIVESNELDNCSDHATFVAPPIPKAPDLLVSKQVDSLSTSPGAALVYTISVSNTGNVKAKGWDGSSGITITDNLPSQVTFVNFESTNGWVCTGTTSIECHDDGSGLAPGANGEVKIHVTVNTDAAVPIANSATANAAIADDSSTCVNPGDCTNETKLDNNTATVTSAIGSSGLDFAISTITDVPDPVAASQPLKYTIVAVNGGTAPADNVPVRLTIPTLAQGVKFDKTDGSNGFNCTKVADDTVNCIGNLPAGGTTVITASFVVQSVNLAPDVTLTAEIDPDKTFTETDEGNNKKSETTTISAIGVCSSCVDLVAVELLAVPDPANTGNTVSFTFNYANTGDLPTMLNTSTDYLLWLITEGDGTLNTPAVASTPTLDCTVFAFGPAFLVGCKGNVPPASGGTVTVSYPSVSGTNIRTSAYLDLSNLVMESNETNNNLSQSVVIFP